MVAAITAGAANVDAHLMGRVLYEEWAAYWPEHADEPFVGALNATKKYVVSNSLTKADWQKSEVVSGDVASKRAEIKAEGDGDIVMSDSATTARGLLRECLLDELHLLIHPIVVDQGLARLFPADEPQAALKLELGGFGSGVVDAVTHRQHRPAVGDARRSMKPAPIKSKFL
jgi:dihydrofolate reductase